LKGKGLKGKGLKGLDALKASRRGKGDPEP